MLPKEVKKAGTVGRIKQLVSSIEEILNKKADRIIEPGANDDSLRPEKLVVG